MPIIELRTRDGNTLFTSNSLSITEALEEAFQNGTILQGLDLTFHNLAHITLDGCIFRFMHFFECDMEGANLSECLFENCDFSYCDMTDACFCYSKFVNCTFKHNTYTDADISSGLFINCHFEGTHYNSPKHMLHCEFVNCTNEKPLENSLNRNSS